MNNTKKPLQKEIFYEDESNNNSLFPFIQVSKSETMPSILYIFEYKETGEFEPGPNGEEVPIIEQSPCQFVNMAVLKEKLKPDSYDEVRKVFGLLPLKEASKLGKEKLEKVSLNIEKIKQEIELKTEELKNKEREKNK